MTTLYNRFIAVTLTISNGGAYNNVLSYDSDSMHIAFEIEKDKTPEANKAVVTIYNISKQNREKFGLSVLGNSTASIDIGYKGGVQNCFFGDIAEIKDIQEGADLATQFTLLTGFNAKQKEAESMSFAKGTTDREIITSLGTRIDGVETIDYRTKLSKIYKRGYVVSGNLLDEITTIAKDSGAKAVMTDKTLVIESNPAFLVLHSINSKTGMVGIPEQITDNEQDDYADLEGGAPVSGGISPNVAQFDDIIDRASAQYGVDRNLIASVINTESGGVPTAGSSAGAQGLMQMMPETAKGLGVKNVLDPEQNIMGGTKYLKEMIDLYDGNLTLALAGYNAGAGNVQKYKGVPPFSETQNYIKKVLGGTSLQPTKCKSGYKVTSLLNPKIQPLDAIELTSTRLNIIGLKLKVSKVTHVGSNYDQDFYSVLEAFYEGEGMSTGGIDESI